jgi:tetratricopeptide (TPR) repeat protein
VFEEDGVGLNPYDALAAARQLVVRFPDYPEAHNNLGSALVRLGHCEEALAYYNKAIALRPDYDEAYYNHGVAMQSLGRYKEAASSYRRTIELQPDYVEAYNQLGAALASLERFDEALASYDHAIELDPEYEEAFYNRGVALQTIERYEEAVVSYDRAIALRPDYPEALKNRGMVLQAIARYGEALADYDSALALRPDHAPTHFSKGACLLLSGDLAHGWQEYEWRLRLPEMQQGWREFPQPFWRGEEPIAGKTILVHAEQGLGDTIQFCRLVAPLAARGALVVLEVPRPLGRLLVSFPGTVQTLVRGDPLPPFDLHCPLLSLPAALGTTFETIPPAPYVATEPGLAAVWRRRLEALPGLRVGVVWAGGPGMGTDSRRSMTLDRLAPLTAVSGVSFVSLQKGLAAAEVLERRGAPLYDFTEELEDFADTAALVAGLDLVISVDTSVAHLAGAMGKPLWLLARFDACWRWLRGRDDSPWYPTARLFRQVSPGDWGSALSRVAAALRDRVGDSIG